MADTDPHTPGSQTASGEDASLLELFTAERETLSAVQRCLDDERRALLGADAAAIEAAAAAKRAALQQHAAQQQRRLSWMATRHLAPTTPLAELAALSASDSSALDGAATALAGLARECDTANRRNGVLIQRLQERTRRALGVLRGSDDRSDIYSLSGAQQHGSDRRTLGKA